MASIKNLSVSNDLDQAYVRLHAAKGFKCDYLDDYEEDHVEFVVNTNRPIRRGSEEHVEESASWRMTKAEFLELAEAFDTVRAFMQG